MKFFRNGAQIGATNTAVETAALPNAILNFGTLSFNDGINYISTNKAHSFKINDSDLFEKGKRKKLEL